MLSKLQIENYLSRIKVEPKFASKLDLLIALHESHLKYIPFENLDIALNRKIELKRNSIFDKVIGDLRGGFCYELNYCFYLLLVSLGFKVSLISGRVFDGKEYGDEFDHLLLLVDINAKLFIADVGFGDSFLTPLKLNCSELKERYSSFRVTKDSKNYLLQRKAISANWEPQYSFSVIPRTLSDFEPMAEFHQASPKSPFTNKSTCTIATQSGRVTISNKKLITAINNKKSEQTIINSEQYYQYLNDYFCIKLCDNNSLFKKLSND